MNSSESEAETFQARLVETVDWCQTALKLLPHVTPRGVLRSQELRPVRRRFQSTSPGLALKLAIAPSDDDAAALWLEAEEHRGSLVEQSIEKRRSKLCALPIQKSTRSDLLAQGQLFVYFPDLTDHDGLTESQTHGYLDVYDTPPWDSWIAFIKDNTTPANKAYHSYVISWVPAQFIKVVQRGIDVEALRCIGWLRDVESLQQDVPMPDWLRPWISVSSQSAGERSKPPRRLPRFPH